MIAIITLKQKLAVATDHGEFNLVFSTTHLLGKEQANVHIRYADARV